MAPSVTIYQPEIRGIEAARRGLRRVPCGCGAGGCRGARVFVSLMSGGSVTWGEEGSVRASVEGSRHVHFAPHVSQV